LIEMVNFDTSFFCPLRASPMQSPVFAIFGKVTAVAVSLIFSVGHLISWCATLTFWSKFMVPSPGKIKFMSKMKGTLPS